MADEDSLDELEEKLVEEAVEEDKKQLMKIDNRSIYTIRQKIIAKGRKLDESAK